MKNYLFLLASILLLVQCKSKKTSLQDDDNITPSEFVEFYPEVTLPFRVADSSLLKKETDSSLFVGYKIFTRFVPDSIVQKDFGKTARPVITALGKAKETERETYLFSKAVSGTKRVAYMTVFNRKNEFLGAIPLVKSGFTKGVASWGMLDNKFQITTFLEKRGGATSYKRNVYFYNAETKDFTLIFTEPNEELVAAVINPIDTFPKKSKYAGDYVKDKKNFVSIRDGRKPGEVMLFIHFEKNNGTCNGELKGTARFISATKAQYHENANPCAIELNFTASRVALKETAGCGTYRDIKCFFDGSYTKKKKKS